MVSLSIVLLLLAAKKSCSGECLGFGEGDAVLGMIKNKKKCLKIQKGVC